MALNDTEKGNAKDVSAPPQNAKRVVKVVRRVKKAQASGAVDPLTANELDTTVEVKEVKEKVPLDKATKINTSQVGQSKATSEKRQTTSPPTASEKTQDGAILSQPISNRLDTTKSLPVSSKQNGTDHRHKHGFFQRCASSLFKASLDRDDMDDNVEDDLGDLEEANLSNDNDDDADEDKDQPRSSKDRALQHDYKESLDSPDQYNPLHRNADENRDIEQAVHAMFSSQNQQSPQRAAIVSTGGVANNGAAASGSKPQRPIKVQVRRLPSQSGSEDKKEETVPVEQRKWRISLGAIIVKSINIMLPLFFIAIVILHIVKIGQPANASFAQAVMSANKIAVTLWPIMFAAIATQSLKTYANFQAERGIKLMTLEQLLHSSSFSSALKQPLLLRKVSWASVLLFLLWALSPLASQALQNMAYLRASNTVSLQNITYAMTGGSLIASGNGAGSMNAIDKVQRDALFSSAILASKDQSPQDSWGYPRIPDVRSLRDPDTDGWYTVTDEPSYTSLLGLPYLGVSTTQETRFNATTAYFSFNCTTPIVTTTAGFDFANFNSSPTYTLWLRLGTYEQDVQNSTFEWASLIDIGDVINGGGLNGINNATTFTYSKCSFENAIISAQIDCTPVSPKGLCSVTKVKPYDGPDQQNYTVSWNYYAMSPFLDAIPGIKPGTPSMQEGYVGNANTSELFSERIQTLVNTFHQVAGSGTTFPQGLDLNRSSGVKPPFIVVGDYIDQSMVWDILPYWVAVFLFCNVAILLLALADIVCEAKTVSPDFLGFASSVVRSNQRLRKEMQSRKLSGHEKARAMSDLCVMLQDDNGGSERGKIVLAPRSTTSVRLRKDRDYQ